MKSSFVFASNEGAKRLTHRKFSSSMVRVEVIKLQRVNARLRSPFLRLEFRVARGLGNRESLQFRSTRVWKKKQLVPKSNLFM